MKNKTTKIPNDRKNFETFFSCIDKISHGLQVNQSTEIVDVLWYIVDFIYA